MPEAGADGQVLGERQILQQGRPQLDELFADADAVVDRCLRATQARQLAAVEGRIGYVGYRLLAVLESDVDTDAVMRGRQLDAVLAELASDVTVDRAQAVVAGRGSEQIQVLELILRYTPVLEDVP